MRVQTVFRSHVRESMERSTKAALTGNVTGTVTWFLSMVSAMSLTSAIVYWPLLSSLLVKRVVQPTDSVAWTMNINNKNNIKIIILMMMMIIIIIQTGEHLRAARFICCPFYGILQHTVTIKRIFFTMMRNFFFY